MSSAEINECLLTIKEETDDVETKISSENDPLQFNSQDEETEKKVNLNICKLKKKSTPQKELRVHLHIEGDYLYENRVGHIYIHIKENI